MNERNGKAVLKATSKVATRQSYRHARNGRPPKPQADGNDFTRKVRNVSRALERMQSSMISMMGPSMTSTPCPANVCLSIEISFQYLADEALHLSASRKFAKEEKSQRRPLSVTGCSFRPQKVHSGSEGAHYSPRRHRFWLRASRHGDDRCRLKEATLGYRKGQILMP